MATAAAAAAKPKEFAFSWEGKDKAGILETLLDRLAIFKEKTLAIRSKIKSALGILIGGMVVAMYLPIFKLGGAV